MLRTGWLIGFAILWLILQIICSICAWSTNVGDLTPLTQFTSTIQAQQAVNILGFITSAFTVPFAVLQLLLNLFTFNYGFFTGIYVLVQYLFICVSFGFGFSLVATFMGRGE